VGLAHVVQGQACARSGILYVQVDDYLVMRGPVGIVGFRGCSGPELVSILGRHSRVAPVLLEHRSDAGDRPAPRGHAGPRRIPCTPDAARSEKLAAVFLATPAAVLLGLAPTLLDASG